MTREAKAESSTQELATILGRRTVTVQLGGMEITLAPFSLTARVEYEEHVGPLAETIQTAKGSLYAIWLSAKRGGYTGTPEELGEHITAHNVDELLSAVLDLVAPPEDDASGEGMRPATGPA